MKYFAVIDDALLENFSQDMSKNNELIMKCKDARGYERGLILKPIKCTRIITENGESCYITQENIDTLFNLIKVNVEDS